jgi:hypothetical protein
MLDGCHCFAVLSVTMLSLLVGNEVPYPLDSPHGYVEYDETVAPISSANQA